MVYCINHLCSQRHNSYDADNCLACGTPLLINGRIRLLRPLRPFDKDLSSFTDVFEVQDLGTTSNPGSQVRVMKILKWNEPKLVELVRYEALALQLIEHPGIPRSTMDDYFTFTLKDTLIELHCIVMQKIEGENLREWVKISGRVPQNLAIDWFHQLIDILDLIHRSGFFHRDIKPENIVHQPDGKLVLVDFGAARRITRTYLTKISTSGGTSTGLGSGHEITSIVTPLFTPLEQIEGQAVPQSDFFALGRTFINLVTGMSLIDIPKNEDRSRLIWRKYAPHIDKPFADLLDDMMSPAPGQRPQNTKIILQRLERLPLKLKFNRVVRSKIFLLSLAIFSLIVSINCFEGIKLAISNYYFNIASRHQNEPKIARENYELAIKFNPKDVDAYNNLALACQLLADTKCMNESYERAFKLKPDNWVSHYNLGNFYDDRGKYEQAEQQYKLAIQYSNNQAMNALSNLARLKNRQEKYSQAAELAIQGLSHTQNREWQAGLYKNLGWARFKQQRYAEAEEYLQKSVKLDSQRVDAYCLLAQTYEALRNLSKAEIYWEVCLVANSGLPEVQEWRQQVLQRIFKEN